MITVRGLILANLSTAIKNHIYRREKTEEKV
jgi:hypothetical protein